MALNASLPPGGNFDLTNWKITLPVDASGATSGTAVEVQNLSTYSSKYFYTAPDGAMVFYAAADGATTSGSSYARSELREMNGSERAAWKLSTGGSMVATLEVDAATMRDGQGHKIVVGQIHGQSDELVRLYWQDNTLFFANDQSLADNKEHTFTFKADDGSAPNVSLNEKFSYEINAKGNVLDVDIYADGKVYHSHTAINSVWQSDSLYFKAGAYNGANETNGSGFSQASFYDLRFSHSADLTPTLAQGGPAPSPMPDPDPDPTPLPTPEDHDVTANHDSYTIAEGGVLSVSAQSGILANDVGLDGKLVNAGTFTTMQGGTVAMKADGSFTYTPKTNFFGSDGFSYFVRDADGDNDVAFVKIKVTDEPESGPTDPDPVPTDGTLPVTTVTKQGTASNNYVIGTAGNDLLKGNAGRDVLWGHEGSDVLWGGVDSDADAFVFDTAIGSDVDWIMDFDVAHDGIRLENAVFGKLVKLGTLGAEFFALGAAQDANDHIVYNQATGALSYDADGSGSGAAVQFAQVANKAALTAADFVVI